MTLNAAAGITLNQPSFRLRGPIERRHSPASVVLLTRRTASGGRRRSGRAAESGEDGADRQGVGCRRGLIGFLADNTRFPRWY